MAEENDFRVAFVGCGSYNHSLAKATANCKSLTPIACYDINAEAMHKFAADCGVEPVDSLERLVERSDVDGVIIASPNNAHRSNVEVATAAGKHVFVDKPIANTLVDALAIIEAADRAGVALQVGHNGRRMQAHRKMREMIDAGAIGVPVTVEANFSHSGGRGLNEKQWRFYRDQCPALPLMQLGVHFADTIQYLLGNVQEVASFMSHIATPADNEDVTVSVLRFANGLLGYLGSNYATPAVYYANVYGTEGNLYSIWGSQLEYRRARSNDVEKIELQGIDTQVEELEEFARCARTGERCEVDGEAGLRALAVVQAALRSHETGQAVKIDELIEEARGQRP